MSRGGVVADLIRQDARQLKMPGAARAFEALGRQAREEKWSFEDYLHEVLSVEIQSRRESAIRQRVQDARFPEMKTLDQFDFKAAEGVDATLIAELARGGWIERAENVLLAGPIGTGKTHLAIALGIEAARQRRRVMFTRAADLVRTLVEARDARELGRMQRRLDRVDVLILDEVGFVCSVPSKSRHSRARESVACMRGLDVYAASAWGVASLSARRSIGVCQLRA